ncbi:hypothetical protein NKR19_g4647 [Coniochaeta hoffmannii]|uniref:Uncharacterized protein n=1 Tax=Coniochaeta hoffmannii TaxID=91930 RepID=A0AA38RLZ1_9PEZI|nr:hypothetical protein NKR19_g4647 [Coniochaeta hoffmannii]
MSTPSASTPVRVPSAASGYTAATLDPDLRSQINTLLIKDGHINKIQEHLLHALHAHPSNWPTAIENHALSLLRSGEVTSFPALMRRVMDDVRHQTAMNSSSSSSSPSPSNTKGGATTTTTTTTTSNGVAEAAATTNGGGKKVNGAAGNNGLVVEGAEDKSLALPQGVVEDALRVTRESLEMVCEIEGVDT